MPLTKYPAGPIPVLENLVGSPVPKYGKDFLIARSCLAHVGVAPENSRAQIEVLDGRPWRGQEQQTDVRRSDGQRYPVLNDEEAAFISYATQEYAPARDIDNKKLAKYGEKAQAHLVRMLALAKRTLFLTEERLVSELLFTAANWGANTGTLVALAGGSGVKFTAAGATEFSDLALAARLAAATFGNVNPTDMVIGVAAFDALKSATETRINITTNLSSISLIDEAVKDLIRSATGVIRVHVGRAQVENARSGAASSKGNLWGDSAAFYWRDVDATPSPSGIETTNGTALGIYVEGDGVSVADEDGLILPGYFGHQIVEDNPPTTTMVAGTERAQVFLTETDQSTGTVLPPRGYLVTDLV